METAVYPTKMAVKGRARYRNQRNPFVVTAIRSKAVNVPIEKTKALENIRLKEGIAAIPAMKTHPEMPKQDQPISPVVNRSQSATTHAIAAMISRVIRETNCQLIFFSGNVSI